jgi:hypothetical protein
MHRARVAAIGGRTLTDHDPWHFCYQLPWIVEDPGLILDRGDYLRCNILQDIDCPVLDAADVEEADVDHRHHTHR